MITAGCDVGSLSAKAVILGDETIRGTAVIRAGTDPVRSAETVLDQAIEAAGLTRNAIQASVATGYGKEMIPFAGKTESEIVCHARGAFFCRPECRTVIDIGGQDAKAIRLNTDGTVTRYLYNDKCASGTGRFLEIIAKAMDVPLAEMGEIGGRSGQKLVISNQCVIFAETEVVSLINEGRSVPDIIAALHRAMAGRVAALALGIGVEEAVVMTGGVAKNSGVFEALSAALRKPVLSTNGIDPQLTGALGAALIAAQNKNGAV